MGVGSLASAARAAKKSSTAARVSANDGCPVVSVPQQQVHHVTGAFVDDRRRLVRVRGRLGDLVVVRIFHREHRRAPRTAGLPGCPASPWVATGVRHHHRGDLHSAVGGTRIVELRRILGVRDGSRQRSLRAPIPTRYIVGSRRLALAAIPNRIALRKRSANDFAHRPLHAIWTG
jgi:hypothetical protein